MSQRNRRRFIEDSMFAAAAVAAGSGAELLASPEQTSRQPHERLGVAVVGLRGRGGTHLGVYSGRRDTQVLYVCDPDESVGRRRAVETAKRQGGRAPRYEPDLRRALDDPRVDIVSIATPNHWHALAALWAMQANKDVYVEAPAAHTFEEGIRLVQQARRQRRICQVGVQCRSNPALIAAMHYLHEGRLGAVKLARGICFRHGSSIGPQGSYTPPTEVDYNLWLGPAPLAPLTRPKLHYHWRWQWEYGSGELGGQAIHPLDVARWGLGARAIGQHAISFGDRHGPPDAGQTANAMVVWHQFPGAALTLEIRSLPTGNRRGAQVGVIFECEEGCLVVPNYHSAAAFDTNGCKIQQFSGGGRHLHFENFLRAVRTRRISELNADIEEGHLSGALRQLGNISYRLGHRTSFTNAAQGLDALDAWGAAAKSLDDLRADLRHHWAHDESLVLGRPLVWNNSTESFADDVEAQRLLRRKYRDSFRLPKADIS